jgi:hypothetical protein
MEQLTEEMNFIILTLLTDLTKARLRKNKRDYLAKLDDLRKYADNNYANIVGLDLDFNVVSYAANDR